VISFSRSATQDSSWYTTARSPPNQRNSCNLKRPWTILCTQIPTSTSSCFLVRMTASPHFNFGILCRSKKYLRLTKRWRRLTVASWVACHKVQWLTWLLWGLKREWSCWWIYCIMMCYLPSIRVRMAAQSNAWPFQLTQRCKWACWQVLPRAGKADKISCSGTWTRRK